MSDGVGHSISCIIRIKAIHDSTSTPIQPDVTFRDHVITSCKQITPLNEQRSDYRTDMVCDSCVIQRIEVNDNVVQIAIDALFHTSDISIGNIRRLGWTLLIRISRNTCLCLCRFYEQGFWYPLRIELLLTWLQHGINIHYCAWMNVAHNEVKTF